MKSRICREGTEKQLLLQTCYFSLVEEFLCSFLICTLFGFPGYTLAQNQKSQSSEERSIVNTSELVLTCLPLLSPKLQQLLYTLLVV